jgi:hypothetical protein
MAARRSLSWALRAAGTLSIPAAYPHGARVSAMNLNSTTDVEP